MKIVQVIGVSLLCTLSLFSSSTDRRYITSAQDVKAFSTPLPNLTDKETDQFILGRSFFTIPWVLSPSSTTARDGLGPLYSANSCVSCHPNHSLGEVIMPNATLSRAMVSRLSLPFDHSLKHQLQHQIHGFVPEPIYGAQLSINGTANTPFEGRVKVTYHPKTVRYPDGTSVVLSQPSYRIDQLNYGQLNPNTIISLRQSPALVGLGFIEDLSDEAILAHADEKDKNNDGISGRPNKIYKEDTKNYQLGRYTHKASSPSLRHQIAAALHHDMGLTTSLFPKDNCTLYQTDCLKESSRDTSLDLPNHRLDAIEFYLKHLKIPLSKNNNPKGQKLFKRIGCTGCHIQHFVTQKGVTIHPYSDFLLHDMGEELSDGRQEHSATPKEWRTTPLWGIGSYKATLKREVRFLHDGRAKSVEEAILWHGGEASKSKKAFMNLTSTQRQALITFIEGL